MLSDKSLCEDRRATYTRDFQRMIATEASVPLYHPRPVKPFALVNAKEHLEAQAALLDPQQYSIPEVVPSESQEDVSSCITPDIMEACPPTRRILMAQQTDDDVPLRKFGSMSKTARVDQNFSEACTQLEGWSMLPTRKLRRTSEDAFTNGGLPRLPPSMLAVGTFAPPRPGYKPKSKRAELDQTFSYAHTERESWSTLPTRGLRRTSEHALTFTDGDLPPMPGTFAPPSPLGHGHHAPSSFACSVVLSLESVAPALPPRPKQGQPPICFTACPRPPSTAESNLRVEGARHSLRERGPGVYPQVFFPPPKDLAPKDEGVRERGQGSLRTRKAVDVRVEKVRSFGAGETALSLLTSYMARPWQFPQSAATNSIRPARGPENLESPTAAPRGFTRWLSRLDSTEAPLSSIV